MFLVVFSVAPRVPVSTLFPYTTLFRSRPSQSLSGAPIYAIPDQRDFTIRKVSDKWSTSLRQASTTGQQLQVRSEEHTSELQSRFDLVCRLLLEKKNEIEPS